MRVLIACEHSGVVRRAMIALGHDAWSCCHEQAEDESPRHLVGDVLDAAIVNRGWDMMIAHPDCTYLTVAANAWSGAEWRIEARLSAMHFVRSLWAFPIDRICIENPIGVLSTFWRRPDQIIQPHEFGEDASKATCLWLKGLQPLEPTLRVKPRMVNGKPRWGNQMDSGQNKLGETSARWMQRARTYEGIAVAMAAQWGTTQ